MCVYVFAVDSHASSYHDASAHVCQTRTRASGYTLSCSACMYNRSQSTNQRLCPTESGYNIYQVTFKSFSSKGLTELFHMESFNGAAQPRSSNFVAIVRQRAGHRTQGEQRQRGRWVRWKIVAKKVRCVRTSVGSACRCVLSTTAAALAALF